MKMLHSNAESKLSAMQLVRSPSSIRALAWTLLTLIVFTLAGVAFVPWQQSARGTGRVVAFAPLERQQVVQAPIYGRIKSWAERTLDGRRRPVMEGDTVKKGDFILEIEDIDPELMSRLMDQLDAALAKLQSAEEKVLAYSRQVEAYRDAGESAVKAAREAVFVAEQELTAAEEGLLGAKAAYEQEQLDLERQRRLNASGIASDLKLQTAERKAKEAQAKLNQSQSYVQAARNKLEGKKAELMQKQLEAQAKVEYALAQEQAAIGEVASARKDVLDTEVKRSRQASQKVYAPRDGTLFRLHAFEGGEIVKQGDPLFSLVPEETESGRAIEMWVNGNDLPLIREGRHVRIQFEGWPAVQFVGWPSVAVGTFGGKVVTIDATDDGKGRFRVLVTPDVAPGEAEWPPSRVLRQGVRANGWILLNQVPLWFEVWRQLNGFPQALPDEEKGGDKDDKPAKIKLKT